MLTQLSEFSDLILFPFIKAQEDLCALIIETEGAALVRCHLFLVSSYVAFLPVAPSIGNLCKEPDSTTWNAAYLLQNRGALHITLPEKKKSPRFRSIYIYQHTPRINTQPLTLNCHYHLELLDFVSLRKQSQLRRLE